MARILVIDDEEGIRRVIVAALSREGHQVLSAANGVEATGILKTEKPDLVITDILMPERDGYEVIQALQKEEPAIPIIAMTGAFDNPTLYLHVAQNFGAVRVLAKPFGIEELVAVTREVLSQ